jgi:hypothetical protein
MTQAKIGIRYCGGCNPHYERVEMIQRVQALVGDRLLFIPHDQQGLDGLITVNGCPRACGAKGLNQRKGSHLSMTEKGDLNRLVEWLFTFEQQADRT